MNRKIINWIPTFVGITLLFIVFQYYIGQRVIISPSANLNKLKVTTSFYPLTFLVEQIGGDQVQVTTLTPPGAEPHDFEPSTRDVAELENQDIILLNGGGLEGYGEKIQANIDSKKTNLILVGEPFMTISQDPHVWLDPVLYSQEAEIVATAFSQKDPHNTNLYKSNLKTLQKELSVLAIEFENKLNSCNERNIITSHTAFAYLVKRYRLEQTTLTGLSPEQEPSAKTLSDVVQFAKANNIRYIFFEELVSPSLADTIAREIGAQTLVLSPLEGLTKESQQAKKTYISIQKENLANLQIALGCSQ